MIYSSRQCLLALLRVYKSPPKRVIRPYHTSPDVDSKPNPPYLQSPPLTRHRRTKRVISTLDQRMLRHSDFCDISNLTTSVVTIRSSTLGCARLKYCASRKRGEKFRDLTFPVGTHGFFYYYSPPGLPYFAGEVRFRITPSTDPASFATGVDLSTPTDSGLVTPAMLQHCETMARKLVKKHLQNVLYTLDFPFYLRFNTQAQLFWAAGESQCQRLRLASVFTDRRCRKLLLPYSGSAMARFEPSPFPEDKGKQKVVIRILRILEPVRHLTEGYDGFVAEPMEGHLISRRRRKTPVDSNDFRASSWSLLKPPLAGLRTLPYTPETQIGY
ncbi:hypothetical protein BD779DRAFT_1536154 [Infundibulicybe gibba]|nr:hypothetical protein BD779DRAFT_1536154 [Infundibulicybe gibba]